MIGISVYLTDPLAEHRLIEAKGKGVTRAFTSLHIPEESGDLQEKAQKLLTLARELGMEVYADVSLRTPKHLGVEKLEDLTSFGVLGLRLDDFFDHETILQLSKRFRIALNASILFEEDLIQLFEKGLEPERLIAWHNFYPRRETGLEENFFRKQSKLFKDVGIPVAAFVPGRGEKRGPLFEGLPTLERHRELDPFVAAVELLENGCTDVYVGDPDPGEGLLEQLVRYDTNRVLPIRVRSNQLTSQEYQPRPDMARDVIRMMDTRSQTPIEPANTVERTTGSVTMDNDRYGRYRGEIQITLCDLRADERVNVIGEVIPEDLPLLKLIRPKQRIYLEVTQKSGH